MKRLIFAAIPLHRAILVTSTVAVAIAASRLAMDPGETSGWLVLVGGGIFLALADVCRDMAEQARALAASSGKPVRDVLEDVFEAESVPLNHILFFVGFVILVAGVVLYAVD